MNPNYTSFNRLWLQGCSRFAKCCRWAGKRMLLLWVLLLFSGLVLLLTPLPSWAQNDVQNPSEETPVVDRHTVQVGETLSAIALRYALTLEELMAYNGITDPDEIVVGQVLTLPPGSVLQPEPTPLPVHEVQAGETLSQIAEQYDVSLADLMWYNGLDNADSVVVGRRLRIPPASIAEEPTTAPPPSPSPAAVGATPTADGPATAVSAETPTPRPTSEADATAAVTTPEAIATDTPTRIPATVEIRGRLDDGFVQRETATLNRTYTVAVGDTFTRIALRTGVDPEALRRLNRMGRSETANLLAGQTLLLPATGEDLRVRRPDREYVVQPGDSLGKIAEQFGLTTVDLLTANYLADPDNVAVGQRLTIPEPASVETVLAKRDGLVGPQKNGYYYYTVQPGDTISQLAQAFNSTKLAIFEYNKDVLPDQETVYTGVEIRVPYGPPTLPNQRPPVPASGSSFLVSLSRQQCWLFHGDRVAYEWTCSTGYGEWITRIGSFAVQSKIENAESSAYRLDMPYWLGIYNVGPFENGIHGLPVDWDTGEKIWEGLIGEPATFGCAMLNDHDAAILFTAAYIGMPIHIMN